MAEIHGHSRAGRKLFAVLAGMLLGAAVFLILYGAATLSVTNDGWILNGYDETDIQQHYAGWLLFRNSHWAFPLGLCDTLAWPQGTCISFTDSLPWISLLFKALRGALPSTFQWFGPYTLFCFMMQGAAGALLAGRIALWGPRASAGGRPAAAGLFTALGGLLFACDPVLWERAFRHVALASQYLYLFALYFYLEYRAALRAPAGQKAARWPWALTLLPGLAVGIHPYFLPPVLLCTLLAAGETWRAGGLKNRRAALLALGQLAAGMAGAVLGGAVLGVIGGGVSASRYGYGEISMNLNALFNPAGGRGGYRWSMLLPVLPMQPGQYDGFNYLGAGVLALAVGALSACAVRLANPAGRAAAAVWLRRNAALLLGCGLLALFAVSNNIYFGNTLLAAIPFPGWLTDLCGVFRSSGRMFWLVGGCLTVFGLAALWGPAAGGTARRAWLACALLAAVICLQGYDLSAVAAQKKAVFAAEVNATVANDPQTQNLGAGHTKLLSADAELREDRLRLLAILAGQQGLATNLSIAVSGEYPQAAASVAAAAEQLAAGGYDADTVYVTTAESQYQAWQQTFGGDGGVALFVANSCYFLVPLAG